MSRNTWAWALLLLCLAAGAVQAQSTADPDRFFGLEWSGGERRGRPNVHGYVVNNYRVRAVNMRLFVESLDAAGKAVDTAPGFVAEVPAGGRVYFEVPIKTKGPRYRVTITGWDWRDASLGQ